MSDPLLDALAESARNRGLKLVRSRVRTPGKRRFGKVGVTDPKGKPVFGMDPKGPTGTPDEVEEYLRNLDTRDWGASLDGAVRPKKQPAPPRTVSPRRSASTPRKPELVPKPMPDPVPKIREAKPDDAPRLVELMKLLDHDVGEKGVRTRITALAKDKLPQLVATLDTKVVGLIGVHAMIAIHRDQPLGRITILVVDQTVRDVGIGRMLTEAAEKQLKKFGCGMVEVTSNDRLTAAHAFYRHMGYERSSIRFFKKL